jgi:hypothetical protein
MNGPPSSSESKGYALSHGTTPACGWTNYPKPHGGLGEALTDLEELLKVARKRLCQTLHSYGASGRGNGGSSRSLAPHLLTSRPSRAVGHYFVVVFRRAPTYTNRLQCVECGRVSREDERGWRAYLTDDEPPEVAVFCGLCAERELRDGP